MAALPGFVPFTIQVARTNCQLCKVIFQITGFIVTALSMGLLIMISWFIISQMDFILVVVTWTAKSLEESMMIFGGPTKEHQDDSRLSPELPD